MNRFAKIVIVLAMGILACARKEPAAAQPPQAITTAASSAATAPALPPPAAPAAAPATTSAAAPTTGAIAGTDGERAGAHIDVTELKRTSGGTVSLKFILVNNTGKDFILSGDYLGDPQVTRDAYQGVSGIHLLDPVNKKKYFVVTDAEKNCVCSKNVANVHPGDRVSLWARFPAPPPEVQKVTIEIPHFQPMDDVPVSQ